MRWVLNISGAAYNFTPNTTFGFLDFGRGIWPYKFKWNWVNASGVINNKIIGLNLGGKWSDGTGSTENALIIYSKLIKIREDIVFEYDDKDFMKPWSLKTAISNRVNLKFTPFYERVAKSNLLIIESEVHQMIGCFSGTLETDNGEVIVIDSLIGCSEEHFGKW